jgi:hypothetical protein
VVPSGSTPQAAGIAAVSPAARAVSAAIGVPGKAIWSSSSPARLEGRARTLSGPSPELTAARTFHFCPDADRPTSSACTISLENLSRASRLPAASTRAG